ncbi:unnamed protein product [Calypogeia fissa]
MATVRLVALGPGVFAHLGSGKVSGVESCSASVRSSEVSAASPSALSSVRSPFSNHQRVAPGVLENSLSWLNGEFGLKSGSALGRGRVGHVGHFSNKNDCKIEGAVRAFSLDATEETSQLPRDEAMKSLETSYHASNAKQLKKLAPENRADDISLHNPLLRQHRMGCGWLGVILEWEGVIVEDDAELERNSWTALAEEEGRRPPPFFVLKRAEGMKNEQAIMEVLCWSRDFRQVKRLAARKEELYEEMQGGMYRLLPGSREFVESLKKFDIPIAIASTRPRKYIERAIEAVGMEGFFNLILASEDVYRGKPDPEMFMYAAERLNFIAERCIVFGNSNTSVEAAHDAFMKCVAVAGKHPVFELGAADLVVRRLDNLSMVDLKNLADLESPEFRGPEPEPEMQPEVEVTLPKIATMDW